MKWIAAFFIILSSIVYAEGPFDDFFANGEVRNISLPFTDVEDIIVQIPVTFEYVSSKMNDESITIEFLPVEDRYDELRPRSITITLYPPSNDFEGFAHTMKNEIDLQPRNHSNLVFGKKNCIKTFHLYVESEAFDDAIHSVVPNMHESCLMCGIDTQEGLYVLQYSICYENTISNKEKNHLLEQLDSFIENDVYYVPKN